MTQSLHLAAQTGFSSAAELYQSVRPSYPPQVIDWLRQQLQLSERSQVIDLGAGTGKFLGGVSKSMLKKSRLDFDKIEKCE